MMRIVFFIIAALIPAMSAFGQEVAVELKVLEIVRVDWSERQTQLSAAHSDSSVNRTSFATRAPEAVAQSLERSAGAKLVHSLRFNASDGKVTQVRFASRGPQGDPGLDVGMVFEITPKISSNREIEIAMKANIEIRQGQAPSFTTQAVRHVVHVSEGERIILGGFVDEAESRSLTGIPTLKDNPMLHYLFSEKRGQRDESEIVLMLSPRIVESMPILSVGGNSSAKSGMADTARVPVPIPAPISRVGAPAPKTAGLLYTIQVAAFEKPAAAEALAARLKMQYDSVFIEQFVSDRPVYRVRVGRVDLKAARQIERQLRAEGFFPSVMPLNQ